MSCVHCEILKIYSLDVFEGDLLNFPVYLDTCGSLLSLLLWIIKAPICHLLLRNITKEDKNQLRGFLVSLLLTKDQHVASTFIFKNPIASSYTSLDDN